MRMLTNLCSRTEFWGFCLILGTLRKWTWKLPLSLRSKSAWRSTFVARSCSRVFYPRHKLFSLFFTFCFPSPFCIDMWSKWLLKGAGVPKSDGWCFSSSQKDQLFILHRSKAALQSSTLASSLKPQPYSPISCPQDSHCTISHQVHGLILASAWSCVDCGTFLSMVVCLPHQDHRFLIGK